MAKNFNDETWREFIEKFSSYEGTVSSYCKENIFIPVYLACGLCSAYFYPHLY